MKVLLVDVFSRPKGEKEWRYSGSFPITAKDGRAAVDWLATAFYIRERKKPEAERPDRVFLNAQKQGVTS